MSYNPSIHHRRSIRLKGYDYSSAGKYFITICTKDMKFLFGNIVNRNIILNDAGIIARSCWLGISDHFPSVCLDEFIIMPNHIHGIIIIKESDSGKVANDLEVGANNNSPEQRKENLFHEKRPHGTSKTIGSIVRGYKIGVTKWFRENGNVQLVWKRDYYEHIIRNNSELNRIRKYIINNPTKWSMNNYYSRRGE